jgi:hypothetical protein
MKTRLSLLVPLLALAGCRAENNASVYMAAICAPPDDASNCTFAATCTAQYIGDNFVDLQRTNFLWTFIEVHNQTPNNDGLANSRTNTNDAFVQEYEIEYEGLPVPTATGSIPGSARVPADGTAVISVRPVPESTGNALRASIAGPDGIFGTADDLLQGAAVAEGIAKVRLKGVYADTTSFKTGIFQIPFRVCSGCVGPDVTCASVTDIRVHCPDNYGQAPISSACTAP